MNKAGMEDKL